MTGVRAAVAVFAVLLAGAGVLFVLLFVRRRLELLKLKGWRSVPATLTDVRVETHGEDEARLVVRFDFEVEGRRHSGERLEKGLADEMPKDTVEEYAKELRGRAGYVVRVHPGDVRESVLEADLLPPPTMLLVFAAVFAVIGCALGGAVYFLGK